MFEPKSNDQKSANQINMTKSVKIQFPKSKSINIYEYREVYDFHNLEKVQ